MLLCCLHFLHVLLLFCSEGLYSGHEFAAKAAGRELQGLQAYLSYILHSQEPLYTAMQLLVDYQGYRLIASSLLPIGSTTLKYGSNDAGRTVNIYKIVCYSFIALFRFMRVISS